MLKVGLGGVLKSVRERKAGEKRSRQSSRSSTAAEESLSGVSEWIRRYSTFLQGDLARIAAKVATEPPSTFHEAMQLIWFAHQAIHIEGHGWSCTPDHIDRLLLPYYEADKKSRPAQRRRKPSPSARTSCSRCSTTPTGGRSS